MKELLKLLDETIVLIKSKDESKSSFGVESLRTFEFILFLCLDIVRYEIQKTGQISNFTADAVRQLFAFQCFEYYHQDFPDVYKKCSKLFYILMNYNEKLKNHDLKGRVDARDENWIKYFCTTIGTLLKSKT